MVLDSVKGLRHLLHRLHALQVRCMLAGVVAVVLDIFLIVFMLYKYAGW